MCCKKVTKHIEKKTKKSFAGIKKVCNFATI